MTGSEGSAHGSREKPLVDAIVRLGLTKTIFLRDTSVARLASMNCRDPWQNEKSKNITETSSYDQYISVQVIINYHSTAATMIFGHILDLWTL